MKLMQNNIECKLQKLKKEKTALDILHSPLLNTLSKVLLPLHSGFMPQESLPAHCSVDRRLMPQDCRSELLNLCFHSNAFQGRKWGISVNPLPTVFLLDLQRLTMEL